MSSSSSSRRNFSHEGRVICGHGLPATMHVSHTDKNSERRFYTCPCASSCGLWTWIDPELSPYYRHAFNTLKLQMRNQLPETEQYGGEDESEMKAMIKEVQVELNQMTMKMKHMYRLVVVFMVCFVVFIALK